MGTATDPASTSAVQFIAESVLLALTGGTAGAILGAFATTVYAKLRHWHTVVPPMPFRSSWR